MKSEAGMRRASIMRSTLVVCLQVSRRRLLDRREVQPYRLAHRHSRRGNRTRSVANGRPLHIVRGRMRRNDMRGYQNKDTFGAIFKNTRKRNDKEPDYRGSFQWHGEELDIGGWVKTDRAGNTYLSIRVSEKWVP